MNSSVLSNTLATLARRVFRQRDYVKPLGRWGVEKNPNQQEYASNWASADHCGVCHDHLTEITKAQTPGLREESVAPATK
jgi:hypothetical protein